MSYCGEQCVVKRESEGLIAASLKCRSWLCPDCTDQRKARLTAEAIGGQPTTFLTLTTRRRVGVRPEVAALEISHAWRLLRLRIMRKKKLDSLPFLAVIEAHKSGWPHLHILLRAPYLHQKWLVFLWLSITKSRGVTIQRITDKGRVAGYCAKYCSKCVKKLGTAKRYWQSRDYDQRPEPEARPEAEPGFGWEMWPVPLARFIQMQIQLGRTIVSQSSQTVFVYLDDTS